MLPFPTANPCIGSRLGPAQNGSWPSGPPWRSRYQANDGVWRCLSVRVPVWVRSTYVQIASRAIPSTWLASTSIKRTGKSPAPAGHDVKREMALQPGLEVRTCCKPLAHCTVPCARMHLACRLISSSVSPTLERLTQPVSHSKCRGHHSTHPVEIKFFQQSSPGHSPPAHGLIQPPRVSGPTSTRTNVAVQQSLTSHNSCFVLSTLLPTVGYLLGQIQCATWILGARVTCAAEPDPH